MNNYKHGFTQRTNLMTDLERVKEINKKLMNESVLTTKKTIDKAVLMQSSINDKDNEIKNAKRKIIDNVLKLDNSTDHSTTAQAEQELKIILSHYPHLSSFVAHVRNELK